MLRRLTVALAASAALGLLAGSTSVSAAPRWHGGDYRGGYYSRH